MIYSADQNLEWQETESGLVIPSDSQSKNLPKAFDFFAGCGGMSLGLHQGGFHVVGAMEYDKYAAHTYLTNLAQYGKLKIHFDTPEREAEFEKYLEKEMKRHEKDYGFVGLYGGIAGSGWISNHPEIPGCEHFWIADIRNVTGEMILKELGMKRGELDLVAGGPPCQGYSYAGKRRISDPRNNLVFEYARLIVELNPKCFVMENVPGIITMTTPEGVPILDIFMQILEDGEYATYPALQKMLGINANLKSVMRKRSEKPKRDKKPLASAARVSKQPKAKLSQPSMF
jgi:DNA (cytosine-5)-methyltransferase 1